MTQSAEILHATTVSIGGAGALILGPSGSGKSALALQLIALGATLVADDRTHVQRNGTDLIASAPPSIAGMIEARGVGILSVPAAGPTPLQLVIDMGRSESERLPKPRQATFQGISLPCLHKSDTTHFPSAVLLYMTSHTNQ